MDTKAEIKEAIGRVDTLGPGKRVWDRDPEGADTRIQWGIVKEGCAIDVVRQAQTHQYASGRVRSFTSENPDLVLSDGSLDAGIAIFEKQKVWWSI